MGVDRPTIVEFSFLLAIPTMLAASGYDLYHHAASLTSSEFDLLAVGFGVAFATGPPVDPALSPIRPQS